MEKLITDLREIQEVFMDLARKTSGQNISASYSAFKVSETCGKALEKLKREIPLVMEIEGGGSSWWYVCPECHGNIDREDKWCKHCGQCLKWGKV